MLGSASMLMETVVLDSLRVSASQLFMLCFHVSNSKSLIVTLRVLFKTTALKKLADNLEGK